MKKFHQINFSLIFFIFLFRDSIANLSNDLPGCYKLDKNGARFQFFCLNAQEIFNETCAKSATFSTAIKEISANAVTELRISGCGINGLDFALKELANVNDVDISYAGYGSENAINWRQWSHLDIPASNKVVKINMSHSDIDLVAGPLIGKLSNFKVIDLSHNKLAAISMNAFLHTTELQELHLHHNKLASPFPIDLAYLTKLKFLDLSANRIEGFYEMKLPTSLETLRLEENSMKSLPCSSSTSKQLTTTAKVYISWQTVENFNIECIEKKIQLVNDSEEFIKFSDGELEMHYNHQSFSKLKKINPRKDRMEDLVKFISTVGPTLQSLETLNLAESNQLKEFDFGGFRDISSLKEIDISKSNLKRVKNPTALQSMQLTKLIADGNQIENAREIIRNLNPSIKELKLSGSPIFEVNAELFKNLVNLEVLELSDTNITIIDSSPFNQLEKLAWFDISGNDLSSAKVPILSATLENLGKFNANGCRIKDAREIINAFGSSIEIINLSGNFIGELNTNTFKGMNKLKKLLMSNTSLSLGNSNPFAPLKKLNELDISHNDLSGVDVTVLRPTLRKLWYLYAAECKIGNGVDVIKSLGRNLYHLDLSGNFVGRVNFTIFNRFDDLANLLLSNTSLQIVDQAPVVRNGHLIKLDLSYNDLSGFDFAILRSVLRGLWEFSAVGCQISNADGILAHFIRLLSKFDLSHNPIGEIKFNEFARLGFLYTLDLSNTNLAKFNFSALEENKQLNSLNISFNHINELHISSMMEGLVTLDVRGNELSEIENLDHQHLSSLKSLGISGNRFSCTFLEQIKNQWATGLKFIGDWDQKDKKCAMSPGA